MEVVKTSEALAQVISKRKREGHSIGFVPTMGALHQGHLSLVHEAGRHTGIVVTSIFVNPTQFNNPDDLKRYPRDLEKDIRLLESTPCHILFAPGVKDIYPEVDTRVFDFGAIDKVMEGKHRPGHFNGVGQVVSKLFDLVKPDKAFFGLKDFQQVAVIKRVVSMLKLDVEIVTVPTVREPDGLAMSSRNMLLTSDHRKNAPRIAKTLFESCNFALANSVAETSRFVIEGVNATPGLEVEYFEIVDGNSLMTVKSWDASNYIVGCIAVLAGEIRLIDNVVYKNLAL